MSEDRLYPVAAIAKMLDQPESTLHYWKNRFDAFLPSVGQGRRKRFRPEALEIFRRIAELLRQGMSAEDVRVELAKSFAMNIEPGREAVPVFDPFAASRETAALIGREIAQAIGRELGDLLAGRTPLAGGDASSEDVAALRAQNEELAAKLKVLEAELTRLRKDGRELEKYLVGKINALKGA